MSSGLADSVLPAERGEVFGPATGGARPAGRYVSEQARALLGLNSGQHSPSLLSLWVPVSLYDSSVPAMLPLSFFTCLHICLGPDSLSALKSESLCVRFSVSVSPCPRSLYVCLSVSFCLSACSFTFKPPALWVHVFL